MRIAAVFGLLTLALAGVGMARVWKRRRPSPEEIERQRRKSLVSTGKMGDGNLLEMRDAAIFYSYIVRGIEYAASQDIASLKQLLPEDPSALRGPLLVRYDARNPANSIVIDEEWTGIRVRK